MLVAAVVAIPLEETLKADEVEPDLNKAQVKREIDAKNVPVMSTDRRVTIYYSIH